MSGQGARSSWKTGATPDLDSPEMAANFLAAVGFRTAAQETKQACQTSMARPSHLRPSTDAKKASSSGLKPKQELTNTAHNSHTQSQLSLSRWNPSNSQGIAKDINPSAYHHQAATKNQSQRPNQQAKANWQQAANEDKEGKSAQDRKETPAKTRTSSTAAVSRSTNKPINGSPAQPNWFEQTARPSLYQSFVPAAPKPETTTPAARGRNSSDIRGPSSNMVRRRKQVSGRGPTDRHSPDLNCYRMPRPNRDFAGSSQSALSSVSALFISEPDVGAPGSKKTGNKSAADIRNTIGIKNHLQVSADNTWFTCNWDHLRGTNDNEVLWTDKYISPFCRAWVEAVPNDVVVSFSQANSHEHWRCDINPNTGSLLPPVDYPDTMADPSTMEKELDWRRQNWTSTLMMRRKVANSRRNQGPSHRSGWGNRVDDVQDDYHEPEVEPGMIVKIHENKFEVPEFNPFVPRIPCFLRPAEKFDMEAVRRIYNWETQNGLQTLDSQPLSLEDFEKIFATTQQLGMPFIVAVRGSARNLGLTKGNISFSPYRQYPKDESDPRGQRRGEIMGFAFVSVREPGLAGSFTGSSRAAAKINVVVRPDCRKKKIGFSLLDMLLTTVSTRYSSQSGYDFIDPDNSPVYKNPESHERQYYRIYFHYLVKHKGLTDGNKKLEQEQKTYDNDLVWIRKMFEDRLNFSELVRFEAAHRSPKCREGPVFWLDEVVFEHVCHFAACFKQDY